MQIRSKTTRAYSLILVLSGLLFSSFLTAATIETNGTGGGDWSNGSTWSGGLLPATGDDVIIKPGDHLTVSGSVTCANLRMQGGASATKTTLTVDAGETLTVTSLFHVYSPDPDRYAVINNEGTITVQTIKVEDQDTYFNELWNKPMQLTLNGAGLLESHLFSNFCNDELTVVSNSNIKTTLFYMRGGTGQTDMLFHNKGHLEIVSTINFWGPSSAARQLIKNSGTLVRGHSDVAHFWNGGTVEHTAGATFIAEGGAWLQELNHTYANVEISTYGINAFGHLTVNDLTIHASRKMIATGKKVYVSGAFQCDGELELSSINDLVFNGGFSQIVPQLTVVNNASGTVSIVSSTMPQPPTTPASAAGKALSVQNFRRVRNAEVQWIKTHNPYVGNVPAGLGGVHLDINSYDVAYASPNYLVEVKVNSYNNGATQDYHSIGLANTVRVLIEREKAKAAGLDPFEGTVVLELDQRNTAATAVGSTIEIPFSYSDADATVENDESYYYFETGYAFMGVKKISVKDAEGDVLDFAQLQKCIHVELTVEEEQYEIDQYFGKAETLTLSQEACSTGSVLNDKSYILAAWQRDNKTTSYPNPIRFELEWVYIDGRGSNPPTTNAARFKSASRVMTYNLSYPIPNVFVHDGTVYARYRMVRPEITYDAVNGTYTIDDNLMVYGEWIYGNFTIDAGTRFDEPKKNFTIESTYAEDDLRKDVITFFDGSGKSRSVMTNLSEESTTGKEIAIIGQSLYDYEGNPVVQVLPVPVQRGCDQNERHVFRYKNNANTFTGAVANVKDHYDQNGGTSVPTMTNGSIAVEYYKGDGADTKHKDYLPQSEGFPYAYTELNGYSTGKPVSQAAPGAPYQFGNGGKNTEYAYSEPTSVELKTLFGNNVSNIAGFYKKTVVIDPNNQGTVTYTDGHGRTVATGILSNTNTDPLLPIDTKWPTRELKEDVFESGRVSVLEDGKVLEVTKDLYIDQNATQTEVQYGLTPKDIDDDCLPGNWCYSCKYMLELTLINVKTGAKTNLLPNAWEDNSLIVQPIVSGNTTTTCGTAQAKTLKFPQGLDRGNYTLVKRLTLLNERDDDMESLLDDYVAQKEAANCIRDLYSFQEEELENTDFDRCADEKTISPCSGYKASLKRDVIPKVGVYGDDNPTGSTFSLFKDVSPTKLTDLVLDDFEQTTAPTNVSWLPASTPHMSRVAKLDASGATVGHYAERKGGVQGDVWSWNPTTGKVPATNEKFFLKFDLLRRHFYSGVSNVRLEVYINGSTTAIASQNLGQVKSFATWETFSLKLGTVTINDLKIAIISSDPGFELDFGIDNISLVGITSCDCEDWGIQPANQSFAGAIDQLKYPYQCLKNRFDAANIQVKQPARKKTSWWSGSLFKKNFDTWVNPAELNKDDFIASYSDAWLDVMVELHPLYCNLVKCELINTPQGLWFKKRLESIRTVDDLSALNGAGATPTIKADDAETILDRDVTFTAVNVTGNSYKWLYDKMQDKIDVYYQYTPTGACAGPQIDITMEQMALIMALGYSVENLPCPSDLLTLINGTSNNGLLAELGKDPLSAGSPLKDVYKQPGLADLYLHNLINLYLGYRSFLVNGIYGGTTNCHTCGTTTLAAPGPDPAGISAPNPFPNYDASNTSVFDLVYDGLKNQGALTTGLTLPATAAQLTAQKNYLNTKLATQKSSDCMNHLEYQIRQNFTITVGTPGPLQTQNDVDLVHLKNNTTVTVTQMITDLEDVCTNPDANPFVGPGTNNVQDVFTKLYSGSNRYYSASDADEIRFAYNPYHIQPTMQLYNNRHLPVNVGALGTDYDRSTTGTTIQNHITAGCTNWGTLTTLLGTAAYDALSMVQTNGSTVVSTTLSALNPTNFPCSTLTNVQLEALTDMMEYGLLSGNRTYGTHFFRLSFDKGGDHFEFTYLSEDPVFTLKDHLWAVGENPPYEKRVNVHRLADVMEGFIRDVVGINAFYNTTVTAGVGITASVWEKHYRVLMRNYFNAATGLELSYTDYREAMKTADVFAFMDYTTLLPAGVTQAAYNTLLENRFDWYKKPPMVCTDEADVSCSCYTQYVTQYRNYLNDPVQQGQSDFMTATGIQSYLSTQLGVGYTGQVHYAEADYTDEMNHLYVVDKQQPALDDLKDLFVTLLENTREPKQYVDASSGRSSWTATMPVQSKDLFPMLVGDTTTNALCFQYTQWSKNEFTFTGGVTACTTSQYLSYPTSDDIRLRTRMCSDGRYWIHLNNRTEKEYKDVYLDYELFNWDFSLEDIATVDDVTPIVHGEGEVYRFRLTATLSDGRVVTLTGRSDEKVADICRIPYAVLWDNGQGKRPQPTINCEENLYNSALAEAQRRYDRYKSEQKDAKYAELVTGCQQADETLTYSFEFNTYGFTLYYYDQAGNLVQTVPPEGVNWKYYFEDLDADGVWEQNDTKLKEVNDYHLWVKQGRNGAAPNAFSQPSHTLATRYVYNTLNQIIQQKTPDGGEMNYWYDALGRIVLSQNAKQVVDGNYNYTLYDGLGRVEETGEAVGLPALSAYDELNHFIPNYQLLKNDIEGLTRNHVVKTTYETKMNGHAQITDAQENLVNRVSTMSFYPTFTAITSKENYNNAVYYSYDVSGNVKTLWRNIIDEGLDVVKRVDYDYDLISGNVKQVRYQDGKEDMLVHRYAYDADNRITKVELTRDGVHWEKGATYEYYLHGPLARTTYGKNQVQGLDYAYTLQGWIKQVNGMTDMGQSEDNGASGKYAKDAMAYVLHYNSGDYLYANKSNVAPAVQAAQASMTGLYNGNIPGMDVKYRRAGVENTYHKTYRYDQLNRIKHYMEPALTVGQNGMPTPGTSNITNGVGEYVYDGNGNIVALNRGSIQPTGSNHAILADNTMSYDYSKTGGMLTSNRLNKVTDQVPQSSLLPNSAAVVHDYEYDATGNLVKDHYNQTMTNWNPIGKVSDVTTRTVFNTTTDGIRPGMDMEVEYDPMGYRIAKSVTDYVEAGSRNCDNYHVPYKIGVDGATAYADVTLCDADDRQIAINGRDIVLRDRIHSQLGAGVTLTDIHILSGVSVSQVPFVHHKKDKNHKEYYIKDAQGNVLATYQRELTVEKSEVVYKNMVENIKLYSESMLSGYAWSDLVNDYATNDLALRENFIVNTYDLLGYGNNPPLDYDQLILENDDRVYRLNSNYGSIYAPQFYNDANTKDDFKNLVKHTQAFKDYVLPVLEQEVIQNGYTLGGSTPQEEALLIYSNMLTNTTPPADHYYYDSGVGALRAYVVTTLLDLVVYTSTTYKQMLLDYLQADPTHMAQLYNLESKQELYISQYANTPDLYITELTNTTQHTADEAAMVAEWMSVTERFDMGDLLKRARTVLQKGSGLDNELLGIAPLTVTLVGGATTLPHTFYYAYAMDLSAHYLYGSSRLGTMKGETYRHKDKVGQHESGNTQYELSDHLGNVRTVITDRRMHQTSGGDEADVVEQSDYYPFGLVMEERHFTANVETRKYEDHQNLRTELKVDANATPRIDDFDPSTYDNTSWCFVVNKKPSATSYLGAGQEYAWGGGKIYRYGNLSQTNATATHAGFMELTTFNGVNVLELTTGGNADLTRFNVHSDVSVPYAGTTTIDTVEVSFDIWMDPDVKIEGVATYGASGTGIRTEFDRIPKNHNNKTWVTIKDTVLINDNNHTFAIRGLYNDNTKTSKIRLKNLRFQRLSIDKYSPMPLTQKEKRDYRFGFNGMEREKQWRKPVYKWLPVWSDDFSDVLLSQQLWVTASGDVFNGTTGELELQSSVGHTTTNAINVEQGATYGIVVELTGVTGTVTDAELLILENGGTAAAQSTTVNGVTTLVLEHEAISGSLQLALAGLKGSGTTGMVRVTKVTLFKRVDRTPRNHDFGARIYDPLVARFLSIDRFAPKFSNQSPYLFASNTPIQAYDINGDSTLFIDAAGKTIGETHDDLENAVVVIPDMNLRDYYMQMNNFEVPESPDNNESVNELRSLGQAYSLESIEEFFNSTYNDPSFSLGDGMRSEMGTWLYQNFEDGLIRVGSEVIYGSSGGGIAKNTDIDFYTGTPGPQQLFSLGWLHTHPNAGPGFGWGPTEGWDYKSELRKTRYFDIVIDRKSIYLINSNITRGDNSERITIDREKVFNREK